MDGARDNVFYTRDVQFNFFLKRRVRGKDKKEDKIDNRESQNLCE